MQNQQQVDGQKILEAIQQQRDQQISQLSNQVAQLMAENMQLKEYIQQLEQQQGGGN